MKKFLMLTLFLIFIICGCNSPKNTYDDKTIDKNKNIDNNNFVFIKGGTFEMGSPETEVDRHDDELLHTVKLDDFYIGKYVITVEQFENFINETNYKTDVEQNGYSGLILNYKKSKWEEGKGTTWKCDVKGEVRNNKQHPVLYASWNDAKEYCKWLSEKYEGIYRLPTEAEWEYACRSGTNTPFNTGDNLTTDQANYNGKYPYNNNEKGCFIEDTQPVGSYPPNKWELYDMHGNVGEWCEDWYYENYYKECKNKGIVENPISQEKGFNRVVRGGSWYGYAGSCRSASRFSRYPNYSNPGVGFRVVFVP